MKATKEATVKTEQKPHLMDATDISNEIFGGKISARNINERHSYQRHFPSYVQHGVNGKKFWRRSEIYKFYGIEETASAA